MAPMATTKSAIALILLLFASQSWAMRCGSYVIQDGGRHGPTMYEVLKKCGEPTYRQGSVWIYEFSRRSWELRFGNNGILKVAKPASKF